MKKEMPIDTSEVNKDKEMSNELSQVKKIPSKLAQRLASRKKEEPVVEPIQHIEFQSIRPAPPVVIPIRVPEPIVPPQPTPQPTVVPFRVPQQTERPKLKPWEASDFQPFDPKRAWVSNLHGNKRHSSRKFDDSHHQDHDSSFSANTAPQSQAEEITRSNQEEFIFRKNSGPPKAKTTPLPKSKTPNSTNSTTKNSRTNPWKGSGRSSSASPPRYVSPHSSRKDMKQSPVVPNATLRQNRNHQTPQSHDTRQKELNQELYFSPESLLDDTQPSNISESILWTEDHHLDEKPNNKQENYIQKNLPKQQQTRPNRHDESRRKIESNQPPEQYRRGRSYSPKKSTHSTRPPEPQIPPPSHRNLRSEREQRSHRSKTFSPDVKLSTWSERIRSQINNELHQPTNTNDTNQEETHQPSLPRESIPSDDYLKRNISPERLAMIGKISMKSLDLKRMNTLLNGLPPSINSLLSSSSTNSQITRDKKDREWLPSRRSSPGANHRRDVLTDAAEWSRLLDWLVSMGMSKYAKVFKQCGATKLSIVELLEAHDLLQMGVSREDISFIIGCIEEMSRRTKSLTEQALLHQPQPYHSPPSHKTPSESQYKPGSSQRRSLSVNSRINIQDADKSNSFRGQKGQETTDFSKPRENEIYLLSFKPYSQYSPKTGLISVQLLLQAFDDLETLQFLTHWSTICSQLQSKETKLDPNTLQHLVTLDFYLHLHVYISPYRKGIPDIFQCQERMSELRRYLEQCMMSQLPSLVSLVDSRVFAAYSGIILSPRPQNNPAYSALFDPKWIRSLRIRLMKFLEMIRFVSVIQEREEREIDDKKKQKEANSNPIDQSQSIDLKSSEEPQNSVDSELTERIGNHPEGEVNKPTIEQPIPPPVESNHRKNSHRNDHESDSDDGDYPTEILSTRETKSKPRKSISVKRMTVMLGSGPMQFEEVQEEISDDDSVASLSLQEVMKLSASSQYYSNNELPTSEYSKQNQESTPAVTSTPPEFSTIPSQSIEIPLEKEEEENENYDFSNYYTTPLEDPQDPAQDLAQDAQDPAAQDLQETVENLLDNSIPMSENYTGYYDEYGQWHYYEYENGYYDSNGEWQYYPQTETETAPNHSDEVITDQSGSMNENSSLSQVDGVSLMRESLLSSPVPLIRMTSSPLQNEEYSEEITQFISPQLEDNSEPTSLSLL